MSDEEFRLPKVTVFDHTVDGYLQLNAFYNYVVKREQEIQGWREKALKWDGRSVYWKELEEQNFNQYKTIQNKYKQIDELHNKLETVREFVLSRREDIEKDMENFGMLEPVLRYFLEAEG